MPRFEPFAALRYARHEPLDEVTAPPYDVLSTADVEALLARHQHNIVAIDVPLDRDGPGRYELAADRLTAWIDDGVLVRDASPVAHAVPHGVHRRDRAADDTPSGSSARSRSSTRVPTGCCHTSARHRRPRPTDSI